MRVLVVTPPDPVITLQEAKEHLRVRSAHEDALIDGLIAAATGHIDGPDGWLGRAIGVQTLEARFGWHESGYDFLSLPYPPVIDLVSVEYLDVAGATRAVLAAELALMGSTLAWGTTAPWVGGSLDREAVRVRYRAGYETLPPAIRAAILLMVGDLYENRSTTTSGSSNPIVISTTVERLLAPFRLWR